ncbi:MAG: C69 family dipeptidase [Candidatus Cryptobacteroides sp.]
MKKLSIIIASIMLLSTSISEACTNIIVSRGASKDGSCMISYAADSHWLYGELYFHPRADHKAGSPLQIVEWDSQRPLGSISQVAHTYQTMGNMNEHQLIIAETTWGGRESQINKDGIMDYGSLIYIALQRCRTAREAIDCIVELANSYGYPSEGETFSIADTQEAWIMDLVGKGEEKGIVWVARRIPDGYICAHANQARICTFPLNDPENCLYAPDVIDFARRMGWYEGKDEDFSFREAYNPMDFGGARGCEARAWSAFNILCDGVFTFEKEGQLISVPASTYLQHVMGYELDNEMPIFVKPSRKLGVKDVADAMRDHYEGTPMDMRVDTGAGGNACPYRWRPMYFEVDSQSYLNERAIATQQTGFWFVAQARGYLPREAGALIWFGTDDAATSYLTPCYVNSSKVPDCFEVGNGDLLHYSPTSAFWACNRIAQACYKMYNQMEPVVRKEIDLWENRQIEEAVPAMDNRLCALLEKGKGRKAIKEMTKFSCESAQEIFEKWVELDQLLLVKFIDGNVKAQNEDGSFRHSEYSEGIPDGLTQPGYTERFKRAIVTDHGAVLEVK